MRRALLAAVAVAALALPGAALEVPFLSGRVNDDAHLLDAGAAQRLEAELKAYEAKTGRQFAVLTIPSLEGAVLEDYSLKVARAWKLGRKDKDDGILLLVSRDDRKLRFEVGYGLEGDLPDALCGRIIRDAIVPRFRGGDYAGGIAAGVESVLSALGAGPAPARARPDASNPGALGPVYFAFRAAMLAFGGVLVMLILATPLVFETSFRNLFSYLVYTGMMSFLFAPNVAWAGGLFAGQLFLLMGLEWLVSHTERGRALAKYSRRKGSFLNQFAAGGSWSGGSSGGGFSGGGGGFGGGGASGSW